MVYFMNKILREVFLLGQHTALHSSNLSMESGALGLRNAIAAIVRAEPMLIKANEELKNQVREALMVGPLSEVEKRIEEIF
jgi:hypothetical protein